MSKASSSVGIKLKPEVWDLVSTHRSDVKNPSWFRFRNSTWNSEELHDVPLADRWILLSLFSIASQKQKGEFDVKPAWLAQQLGVSESQMTESLTRLSDLGVVTVTLRARNAQVSIDQKRSDQKKEEEEDRPSPGLELVSSSSSTLWSDPLIDDLIEGIPLRAQRAWVQAYFAGDVIACGAALKTAAAYFAGKPEIAHRVDFNRAVWIHSWLRRETANRAPASPQNSAPQNSPAKRETGRVLQELEDGFRSVAEQNARMTPEQREQIREGARRIIGW